MSKLMSFLVVKKYQSKIAIEGALPSDSDLVRKVYRMAWPSTLESGLISLISAADTIMVGGLGSWAISAVGAATQPRYLLLTIIFALNIAITVIVSHRKGQEDRQSANKVFRQGVIISVVLGLVLNVIGIIFAEPLILLISGAEATYLKQSIDYFRIIAVSNIFYSVSLTITAAQRGVGNTKIAMKTNLIANLLNVVFNFLLINGIWIFPRLEIIGAGIATAIGNFAGLVLAFQSVRVHDEFLYLDFSESWKVTKDVLQQIWKYGRSIGLEQMFLRAGFITFAMMVARLGDIEFATHMIVMNIMSISFSLGDGLSAAATSLVGQAIGARRHDLALINVKVTQRLGQIISVVLITIIFIFRNDLVGLYTTEANVIKMSEPLMVILSVIMIFQITQVVTNGCLRGAGDVAFVAMESITSVAFLRPTLTFLLAYGLNFGLIGAWIAILTDSVIRWVWSRWRYNSRKWLPIRV